MRAGVIFPSHMADAVLSASTGGWSADYPLANLKDLVRPSNIARASSAGQRALVIDFPANVSLQAVAIIGHNAVAGQTLRVSAYGSPGGADPMVWNSGDVDWFPAGSAPVAGYRSIRPFVLSSPVVARSLFLILNGPGTFEIEAIEAGGFWEWPGLSFGRELGVEPSSGQVAVVGGASKPTGTGVNPRVMRGQIDLLRMSKTQTTGLDFQKGVDLQGPFVWAEDFDDPSTWARKCILARNEDLPRMVGALYRHDRFPARFIEHFR